MQRRLRLSRRPFLILTPLLLACGPSFYQSPPPLETYPFLAPAKTWQEVLKETHPVVNGEEAFYGVLSDSSDLLRKLPTLPASERLAKIDDLIRRYRETSISDSSWSSSLLEFRELAADDGTLAAAGPYIYWRDGRRSGEGGKYVETRKTEDGRSYPLTPQEQNDNEKYLAALRINMDNWLKTAPPALKPNYLVQHANFLLNAHDFDGATAEFTQVISTYPGHPRAEVAALMLPRVALRKSRAIKPESSYPEDHSRDEEMNGLRRLAEDQLKAYLRDYPQGRFVSDAYGWLGAIACDEKRYGDAIAHQIDRLEAQPTRNTASSVLRECDDLFTRVLRTEGGEAGEPNPAAVPASALPWKAIARHPEVTRVIAAQMISPLARETFLCYDNESGDRETLNVMHERLVATQPFVRKAFPLLIAAVEGSDEDVRHPASTLLLFGWAALQRDDPAKALPLFERGLKAEPSDDLLAGKAISLARLNRPSEAAEAYAQVSAAYPDSPLLAGLVTPSAAALIRSGRPAEALLLLEGDGDDEQKGDDTEPSLEGPQYESSQWAEVAWRFGSLENLATLLATSDPRQSDKGRKVLRQKLRRRALETEDFSQARHLLDEAQEEPAPDEGRQEPAPDDPSSHPSAFMDRKLWDSEIQPLAAAYAKLEREGGDNPAHHLEIARLWSALRGKVLMSLGEGSSGDLDLEEDDSGLSLRKNAVFTGVPAATASIVLDRCDELTHALPHFLAAAESADPAIAAPALEAANDLLYQLAGTSAYWRTRAVERNDTALSSALVARLKKDFPKRPEAVRAVAYTFDAVRWSHAIGSAYPGESADRIDLSIHSPEKTDTGGDSGETSPAREKRPPAEWEPAHEGDTRDLVAILAQLRERRKEVSDARDTMDRDEFFSQLNRLDDLILAATQPGMTAERYRVYESGQFEVAAADEALAPLVAYQKARLEEDENGVKAWQDFLAAYPYSPRTETAALRLLRQRLYELAPTPQPMWLHASRIDDSLSATVAYPVVDGRACTENPADLPGYGIDADGEADPDEESGFGDESGAAPRRHSFPPAPPAPKAAAKRQKELAALGKDIQAFRKRYPASRYLPDLAPLDAAISVETGHFHQGLSQITAIFNDKAHPELTMDAALRLAEFGMRLLDPAQRPEVAKAIRETPEILPYVENFSKGNTPLRRLHPMIPWLKSK